MAEELEQSAQDQGQPDTTPDPTPGDGPWAKDLANAFTDPGVRGQVDAFLRERVQPRTTQLEQQLAGTKDAQQLYSNFQDDPISTYLAVSAELFGDDYAQNLADQLSSDGDDDDTSVEEPSVMPDTTQPQELDPRIQALLDAEDMRNAQQAYDAEIARMQEIDPNLDPDLFHPFMAAAADDEGWNTEQAHEMYQNWCEAVKQKLQPGDEEAPAPPALGEGGQSETATAPKQQTLKEAIDAFMAQNAPTGDAPPVS